MKFLKIASGILLLILAVVGAMWFFLSAPPPHVSSDAVATAYICGGVTVAIVVGSIGGLLIRSAVKGDDGKKAEETTNKPASVRPPLPFPVAPPDQAAWPAQMSLLATLIATLLSRAAANLEDADIIMSHGSLAVGVIALLVLIAGVIEGVRALARWRTALRRTRVLALSGAILNLFLSLLAAANVWKQWQG